MATFETDRALPTPRYAGALNAWYGGGRQGVMPIPELFDERWQVRAARRAELAQSLGKRTIFPVGIVEGQPESMQLPVAPATEVA
jgi:hypothetical protein